MKTVVITSKTRKPRSLYANSYSSESLLEKASTDDDDEVEDSEDSEGVEDSKPKIIESEESWIFRIAEVTEIMRGIMRDEKATRLEKLEAGRIIAGCCGILIPEGLLHKTTDKTMEEERRKNIERNLWNELFRDRQKEAIKYKRNNLKVRIKKAEEGELLIHPKILEGMKIELRKLNQTFGRMRKRKKKVIDHSLIKLSTQESTKNILAAFEAITKSAPSAPSEQGGSENVSSV